MSNKLFCTMCFASDSDGSWNHVTYERYCTNCGCGGTTIKTEQWVIDNVRQNASWVGKRYYPVDEDKENSEELRRLRATMIKYPGRSAELSKYSETPNTYIVTQKKPGGKSVSVFCQQASSEQDAIDRTKSSLPYYSEDMLK